MSKLEWMTIENYKEMLDCLPYPVVVYDHELVFLFANKRFKEIRNAENDEDFYKNARVGIPNHQADGRLISEILDECREELKTKSEYSFEMMLESIDGKLNHYDLTFTNVIVDGKRIVPCYFNKTKSENISSMQSSQSYLMWESNPLSSRIRNEKMELIDCNNACTILFKATKEYIIKNANDFYPVFQPNGQRTLDLMASMIEESKKSGTVVNPYVIQLDSEGNEIPTEMTVTYVPYNDGYRSITFCRDLRKQLALEQEAREAHDQLQIIWDNAPIICRLRDDQYNIIDCNKEALRVYGVDTKEEFIKDHETFYTDYQNEGATKDVMISKFKQAVESNERVTFEWNTKTKNGEEIPGIGYVIKIPYRDTYRLVTYIHDARIEKKAEEMILKANQRIRTILNASPQAIITTSLTGQIMEVNQRAVELFKLDSDQELFDNFLKFSPEYQENGRLSKDFIIDTLMAAQENNSHTSKWMHIDAYGNEIPCLVTKVKVHFEDDVRIVVYITDLTELNRLQKQNQMQLNRTQVMIENVPIAYGHLDKNMKYIDCNKALAALYSDKGIDYYLKNADKVFIEKQPNGLMTSDIRNEKFKEARVKGHSEYELFVRNDRDEIFPVEVTIAAMDFEDELSYASFIRDLRKEKEMIQAIENQKQLAEDLVVEKTKEILQKSNQIENHHNQVCDLLAHVIDYRDNITGGHSARCAAYVKLMTDELIMNPTKNYSLSQIEGDVLVSSAKLHDIGKIAIPDYILMKRGPLSEAEFSIIKEHTTIGVEMVDKAFDGEKEDVLYKTIREIILTHQEKWDGSGYPQGLKENEIPITGRIMSICDVYDALTSKRSYKPVLSHDETVDLIKSESGIAFDSELVEVFLKLKDHFRDLHKILHSND